MYGFQALFLDGFLVVLCVVFCGLARVLQLFREGFCVGFRTVVHAGFGVEFHVDFPVDVWVDFGAGFDEGFRLDFRVRFNAFFRADLKANRLKHACFVFTLSVHNTGHITHRSTTVSD